MKREGKGGRDLSSNSFKTKTNHILTNIYEKIQSVNKFEWMICTLSKCQVLKYSLLKYRKPSRTHDSN